MWPWDPFPREAVLAFLRGALMALGPDPMEAEMAALAARFDAKQCEAATQARHTGLPLSRTVYAFYIHIHIIPATVHDYKLKEP